MKWAARILAGLVAVVVLAVLALLIAGKRPNHGHIVREVAIDRPAAQVFRWITTHDLLKKWIGGLIEPRPESSPAEGSEVGRKFRIVETYKGERVDMEMEVMKFERDRDLLIRVASVGDLNNGFVETAEYRLTEADGKTRIRMEAQTDYYGYIPRLFEPLITRDARKKLKQDLNRLKTLVEAEPVMKSGETAPAEPGAEMKRLKFYLGEWDYTESYEKTSFYPNGGKNTGVYTSKLGPGGNSLVQNFHSQGPVGDFEGLIVMTWDPKEKAYKAYVFGNEFPGAIVETGQFEATRSITAQNSQSRAQH
ncbi:MAG TPA: SRPBCC family protein [Candidatus Acidoferrum sp.]|nr:SRPBCC family protein [Candidatus Acidoferrum sp.]